MKDCHHLKMYDVIVIGGGHAGCEAAAAAARVLRSQENGSVLLLTFSQDNIGQMSCNPSIGGVGKGIIVKEIDALSGVMPLAADKAMIHYKTLNSSRGSAVWGPRAQADRVLYSSAMQNIMQSYPNLCIEYDEVRDIKALGDREYDVLCAQRSYKAKAVVITAGTFLQGVMHVGDRQESAGRYGEKGSAALAHSLKDWGVQLARFKTGTPPRLFKNSINFDRMEAQPGDEPMPFSDRSGIISVEQINCFIAKTNAKTHDIIREGMKSSPLLSGALDSTGPRYCPSIEDKIKRFATKESHQLFMEPEGLHSDLIYPNGISTSLPAEIQLRMMRTIAGLENVEVARYGYAIEYTCIDPRQLKPTLQMKSAPHVFFAGQINGTTGYEEAAAQGLIAGANAAIHARGGEEFILRRSDAYIGVMIDDLTTNGVDEPYRMMTSRAEYRLLLRPDNADDRITPLGLEYGVVTEESLDIFNDMRSRKEKICRKMQEMKLSGEAATAQGILNMQSGQKRSLFEILGLPKADRAAIWNKVDDDLNLKLDDRIKGKIYAESVYRSYNERQKKDIDMMNQEYDMELPDSLDYKMIHGLSNEVQSKLLKFRPKSIADMRRIQGITPAAVVAIQLYIRKRGE